MSPHLAVERLMLLDAVGGAVQCDYIMIDL
jgi:hypothetical protein